jgi:chemotaxis protein methyltransferase CheR
MTANTQLSDADFIRISTYMKKNFGINLELKRALIEGRLSSSVAQSPFDNFHDYIDDILNDPTGGKIDHLIVKLTTNYTYFMREETHYNFVRNTVLPEWTKKIRDHDLRTWSAGCSSGEEAYTLAMVLDEYFTFNKEAWDTSILASDISTSVLATAKQGIYPEGHIEQINQLWRKKYFQPLPDGKWQVRPELRKQVVFRRLNLMDNSWGFRRRFHLIFCRNVMIYFDRATKAQLADKFYNQLEPGGYLLIGLSETLSGIYDKFQSISPSIYRKPQ